MIPKNWRYSRGDIYYANMEPHVGSEQAGAGFDASSRRIKQLEARMAEIAQLKTHIIRYARTREVYAAYKKSRHKKEFRAAHAEEIAQHEAAKKAFDALGGKPIPKVAQLSKEYDALLAEKRAEYEKYKALRQEIVSSNPHTRIVYTEQVRIER